MLRFLLLSVLASSAARVPPRPAQPTRPPECYRFSEAFFWDSTVLELLPDSAPAVNWKRSPGRRAVRVPGSRIAPGIAADYAQSSFWDRPAADSLRIAWGTGLHGYDFRFAVRGDSLAGTYTYSSDLGFRIVRRGDSSFVVFPEPDIRPAHAVRVACPGA